MTALTDLTDIVLSRVCIIFVILIIQISHDSQVTSIVISVLYDYLLMFGYKNKRFS